MSSKETGKSFWRRNPETALGLRKNMFTKRSANEEKSREVTSKTSAPAFERQSVVNCASISASMSPGVFGAWQPHAAGRDAHRRHGCVVCDIDRSAAVFDATASSRSCRGCARRCDSARGQRPVSLEADHPDSEAAL